MIHLPRFLRIAIVLSPFLFGLIGLTVGVFTYVSYLQSRNAAIVEQRLTLGRLMALVEQSEAIDQLAAAYNDDQFSKLVFQASTTPLLIAQLQQQLQGIVMKNQAQFVRAGELPARDEQGFTFVGLRLEVTGAIENLTNVLKAIEASVPLLMVEKATITADPMAQTTSGRIPQLAMSLEITAISKIDSDIDPTQEESK